MRPSSIPQLSLRILATGARQLVVQEALDTTYMSDLYSLSLTPITKMGTSSLGGAEMITFFAPPFKCLAALSLAVKAPELSLM